MIIKNPILEKIAVKIEQYPDENLPEIAMCGRSNVGKSSLINAIMGRRSLARTSSKPGKTRTINFYNVDNIFRLVDLPGYGYASVSQSEKDSWSKTINTYLSQRQNLKEVFLLVDFRHEPTAQDKMMYDWIIDSGFSGYVIATKLDKIGKSKLQQHIKQVATKLEIKDRTKIIYCSSETKENIDKVHNLIENNII